MNPYHASSPLNFPAAGRSMRLQQIESVLASSLREGWELFLAGTRHETFRTVVFPIYGRAGTYSGDLRSVIPNPAYDNAAREICRLMKRTAGGLGVYFLEDMPGDWASSTECEMDGHHARAFLLTAMKDGGVIGQIRLTFFHLHEEFGFPLPPRLEVVAGNA